MGGKGINFIKNYLLLQFLSKCFKTFSEQSLENFKQLLGN